MAVKIGAACSDENGKLVGGEAGDQTGREVRTQDWYLDSRGWYIIRAKDDQVKEKLAYAMERACANDNIGYDQNQRYTAYDWCKYQNGGNYDPGAITAKVECDCSALVRLCCAYAGIFVGDFYTGNERSVLGATGQFDIIEDVSITNTSDYAQRGDILVTRPSGHTVIVLSDGQKIEPKPVPMDPIGEAKSYGTMYVRSGAGTSYGILGTVQKAQIVKVLEVCSNNWYKILWSSAPDGIGYTSNAGDRYYEYTAYKPTPTPEPVPTTIIGYATAYADMRVRTGNNMTYDSIGFVKQGQTVDVLEICSNQWYKIIWSGSSTGYGYTSNAGGRYYDYVEKTKPTIKKYKTTANLYVRKGPGTNYATCDVLAPNTVVELSEIVDGWGHLADDRGWSSMKYMIEC